MESKRVTSSPSWSSSRIVIVIVSVMAVFVCCVEVMRIEMVLKQQQTRMNSLENKMTSTLNADEFLRIMEKVTGKQLQSREEKRPEKRRHRQRRNVDATTNSSNKEGTEDQFINRIRKELDNVVTRIYEHKYGKVVRGPPGPRGPRGSRGRRGTKGPRGHDGKKGKQGQKGDRGLKGDTGERGERGPIGPPGPQGMSGPKGEPGQSLEDPRVMISPPQLIVNESQSAIFHYSVRGNPQPKFGWSKVGGLLDKTRGIVNSSRGILEIKDVTSTDSGIYQCNASSILGKALATTRLVVNYRPQVNLVKGPIYVKIGDNVTLPTCHVTGHPTPQVTWSKSIGHLPVNRTIARGSNLTLINVGKGDSGTYVCMSKNVLGSDAAGCVLVVVQLPVFVVTPANISHAIAGSSLTLKCSAKGDPKPVISWRKENGSLPSGRYEITADGSLVLRNIQRSDDGVYVCSATSAGVSDVESSARVKFMSGDCSEIYKSGERRNGVYTVQPDSQAPFQVYCDMTTDGGGWTVFQRRQDGSVDFYLGWQHYKTGFGDLNGEFWLGNDYIHRLTARTPSMLRVELEAWNRNKRYAKYGSFSIGPESVKYRLEVSSYSGDAGEALLRHNNMPFTTKDRDNDLRTPGNVAVDYTGAWWYFDDYASSLNGKYLGNVVDWKGINWITFHRKTSLKFSEMKVRPGRF